MSDRGRNSNVRSPKGKRYGSHTRGIGACHRVRGAGPRRTLTADLQGIRAVLLRDADPLRVIRPYPGVGVLALRYGTVESGGGSTRDIRRAGVLPRGSQLAEVRRRLSGGGRSLRKRRPRAAAQYRKQKSPKQQASHRVFCSTLSPPAFGGVGPPSGFGRCIGYVTESSRGPLRLCHNTRLQ